ncbi:hypothetical protein X975_05561, partial [Stegodyphus mimosarum]
MNFSKSYIAGLLIDSYIYMPRPLKEQVLGHIALKLCQNSSIKEQIFNPELETKDDLSPEQVRVQWERSMKKGSMRIVKTLFLPQILQEQLVDLIRSMALQLLIFSGKWKDLFNIPCNSTADLWLSTDWIENRLYERKIAERIMEDEKFPPDQRYRIACLYCLEKFVSHLWNQLSPEIKENFIGEDTTFYKSDVVYTWSEFLHDSESFESKEDFFFSIFKVAACERQADAFIYAWENFGEDLKRRTATVILNHEVNYKQLKERKIQVLPFKETLNIQLPWSSGQGDIFCYLRMLFRKLKIPGWEAKQKNCEPVIKYLLQWPQENIFNSDICNVSE